MFQNSVNLFSTRLLLRLSLGLVIFFLSMLLFGTKSHAATYYENGSNYPVGVLSRLNTFCSTPQSGAITTWLSVSGDPSSSSASLSRGDPLSLDLNVVTYQCYPGWETGIIWDFYRPSSASYSISGGAQNVGIPSFENSEANSIVKLPPNNNTLRFTRDAWALPIDTSSLPATGGTVQLSVTASTWQYSHRDVNGHYVCVMAPPQTVMETHPSYTGAPNSDLTTICPLNAETLTFTLDVIPVVTPPAAGCSTPSISAIRGMPFNFDVTASTAGGSSGEDDLGYTIAVGSGAGGSPLSFAGALAYSSANVTHTVSGAVINSAGAHTISYTVTVPGSSNGSISCDVSVEVSERPYLKSYGGDVLSGGEFESGGTCTIPNPFPGGYGEISTWSAQKPDSTFIGSSAQLTVSSLLTINEFYSGSLRGAANYPPGGTLSPKSLTFANTGTGPPETPYGGGSGNPRCITDYFNDTRDVNMDNPDMNAFAEDLLNGGAGRTQYFYNSADIVDFVQIGGLPIALGTQGALYVDGDVFMNGNLTFEEGATSREQMPNFYVIVRGDIYIADNVTRLDGTYIAQPRADGTGGNIYTCGREVAAGGSLEPYPLAERAANCGTQLVVNGSLIAKQVRFLRTFGHLHQNLPSNEQPTDYNYGTGTQAAEVINYTPEAFIAPSPLSNSDITNTAGSSTRTTGDGRYRSIQSMPPVF